MLPGSVWWKKEISFLLEFEGLFFFFPISPALGFIAKYTTIMRRRGLLKKNRRICVSGPCCFSCCDRHWCGCWHAGLSWTGLLWSLDPHVVGKAATKDGGDGQGSGERGDTGGGLFPTEEEVQRRRCILGLPEEHQYTKLVKKSPTAHSHIILYSR